MSYFSRLTKIITCNLTELLSTQPEPQAALPPIISEMEEGLEGAARSVGAATAAADRFAREIADQESQIDELTKQARKELQAGNEQNARSLLVWKREIEDVVAGLKQQHQAAVNTRDHLTTTLRAVECRLHEARRRLAECGAGSCNSVAAPSSLAERPLAGLAAMRAREVDSELEAMKRDLQG